MENALCKVSPISISFKLIAFSSYASSCIPGLCSEHTKSPWVYEYGCFELSVLLALGFRYRNKLNWEDLRVRVRPANEDRAYDQTSVTHLHSKHIETMSPINIQTHHVMCPANTNWQSQSQYVNGAILSNFAGRWRNNQPKAEGM